jgi:hypothetical protein
MEDRFPSPIMIDTWSGHTKERYLKSKVNPSSSSNENNDVLIIIFIKII